MTAHELDEDQIKAVELLSEYSNLPRLRKLLKLKVFPAANFTKKELDEIMLLIMAIEYMQLEC